MSIKSYKGVYNVFYEQNLEKLLEDIEDDRLHIIIDKKVYGIYSKYFELLIKNNNTIFVDAKEENKSIQRIIPLVEKLVENKVRRSDVLIAIGGGIIQDISCFIASILLRGLTWYFIPTTLLAQADSCIGSKSSVNLGSFKNILGTFYPPKRIWICGEFLNSLEKKDLQSGIGEILKVHAIDGAESFENIKKVFSEEIPSLDTMQIYIKSALEIKKAYIEIDEFDKGSRNIFNYGHSFGHAIESATHFAIPHGVAVSIGMDMANHIAVMRGILPKIQRERMHKVLFNNYQDFKTVPIPIEKMLLALSKDKKNTRTELKLIFPIGEFAKIEKVSIKFDDNFRNQCKIFLESMLSFKP